MWWFPWLVVWFVFLYVSAIMLPTLYPDASAEERNVAKIMKGVSFFGVLICAMLAGVIVAQRRAILERNQEAQAPTRATWNDVVRRADRGRTVRLRNLTEAQDPVSMDSFEEGQRIVLLPAGKTHTPFHLNMVQEMRSRPPFAHPMTRQRMRNENIEVVRITR